MDESENDVITVKELWKKYKDTEALRGVSFDVREGEVFCILGPNGAGKTTLMKIMTAQLKPTSGSITVFGVDVSQLLSSELRHQIAIVPQEHAIWEDLSVKENLVLIAESYRLKKRDYEAKIEEFLELFGLKEHYNKLASKLSGGQKRKLAIAMSLLHEPKLLFLDEPTAGLDVQARNLLLSNLKALRQRGLTIILTTHLMEEAESLADRVLLLDEGKIVALDETGTLITKTCGEEIVEVLVSRDRADLFLEFLESRGNGLNIVRLGIKYLVGGKDIRPFIDQLMKEEQIKETFISFTVRKPNLNDAFIFYTSKDLSLDGNDEGGF